VRSELLPWGLEGVELGRDVLEVGPGFGATTKVLAENTEKLSVVELDDRYCRRLREELGEAVSVTQGDAIELPYPDDRFSTVVCFMDGIAIDE
jgi:16S rRNA A1518/A1519 N6-dimethyltransferase RsmA/KsgA/DIM1 with predicted DNA glycosylase/AP lyase activity